MQSLSYCHTCSYAKTYHLSLNSLNFQHHRDKLPPKYSSVVGHLLHPFCGPSRVLVLNSQYIYKDPYPLERWNWKHYIIGEVNSTKIFFHYSEEFHAGRLRNLTWQTILPTSKMMGSKFSRRIGRKIVLQLMHVFMYAIFHNSQLRT